MKRWNIFARELEDILASRGLRLGHLDDRAGIHREKVRRLRQSLLRPKSFPVLNPSEMEAVVETFQLKTYEILHLRAAILTAAIEELLMERVDPESGLLAADQILSMLSKALCDNYNKVSALNSIRGEQDDSKEVTDLDRAVEGALLTIDRATKSLYLGMTSAAESQLYTQQAHIQFEAALAMLVQAPDEIKAREDWQVWHDEVQKGLHGTTFP
jgi:hypothetical protein